MIRYAILLCGLIIIDVGVIPLQVVPVSDVRIVVIIPIAGVDWDLL